MNGPPNDCCKCGEDVGRGICGFRKKDGRNEVLCMTCWAEDRGPEERTVRHPNLGVAIVPAATLGERNVG